MTYEVKKLEDGMVSYKEIPSKDIEVEAIDYSKMDDNNSPSFSFGIAPTVFGGVSYFDEENTTKLKAKNLSDAKEEAKSKNALGRSGTVYLFKNGNLECCLNRVIYRGMKKVISRNWLEPMDF